MIFTSAVTEAELQQKVVAWLDVALPAGCVLHHSPNEGRRHISFKKKLRAMGTKYGWPDLEIFVPGDAARQGISTCIFIELKRPGRNSGKLSVNQTEMMNRLLCAGCHWGLARSVAEVRDILDPLVRLRVT